MNKKGVHGHESTFAICNNVVLLSNKASAVSVNF